MKARLITLAILLPFASATMADDAYTASHQGAIDSLLYYQIGGGAAIMPPPVRRSASPLTMGIGWNSDMMCGNFDINTTVRNQLNGMTDGFQQLMGDVIQSATGAVASLPAMVIQRANPQLYDLLTNGVLQGRLDFDKSLLSCQKMAEKMTDYVEDAAWLASAKAENLQSIAASDPDAIRAEQKAAREAAEKGKRWVGGARYGGRGQSPIRLVRDTTVAGWNLLNHQPVAGNTVIPATRCDGEVCTVWKKPTDAADWMNRVLGEQTINLSAETTEQQSGAQAGVGLHPLIHEEQEKIRPLLTALVSGEMKPTFANLAQVSGGSLMLSRGVVEALRDDPDAPLLIERLSGELALSRVTEQALLARRVLLAGRREPNIAAQKEAQTWLNEAGIQLDQELSQIKLEMDMRQALADNAASLTLQRRTTRNQLQGQATQTPDNSDQRIRTLNQPQPDAAP